MYSKGSKTLRLIIGIISIVLSAVIMLQACAVGVGNALSESGEKSGSFGFFLSVCMLISGIVAIAARKTKGGTVTALIFYVAGGLLAISNAGTYSDLKVWSVIALIFAALLLISLFMKKRDGSAD